MVENTMIALGEQSKHNGFKFYWFLEGSLQTLMGHDAFNTSKIYRKFILCQKNIISIALTISHICTTMEKN